MIMIGVLDDLSSSRMYCVSTKVYALKCPAIGVTILQKHRVADPVPILTGWDCVSRKNCAADRLAQSWRMPRGDEILAVFWRYLKGWTSLKDRSLGGLIVLFLFLGILGVLFVITVVLTARAVAAIGAAGPVGLLFIIVVATSQLDLGPKILLHFSIHVEHTKIQVLKIISVRPFAVCRIYPPLR